jgi:hypothetical protein
MLYAPEITIYQLKVVLLGVSPMIWRHFLVGCNRTIADLHFTRQIAISPGFFTLGHANTLRTQLGLQCGNCLFSFFCQFFQEAGHKTIYLCMGQDEIANEN